MEVISPSERARHIRRKREFLLSWGTQEVWTVHPRPRTVEIHYAGGETRLLRENDELESALFPGWRVRVGQFFQD